MAIFRTTSGLNRKQKTTLNIAGSMKLPVYGVCPVEQFEEWQMIQRRGTFGGGHMPYDDALQTAEEQTKFS